MLVGLDYKKVSVFILNSKPRHFMCPGLTVTTKNTDWSFAVCKCEANVMRPKLVSQIMTEVA